MKTDANQDGNSNENREKDRDRRGRGGRGSRFSDANDGGNGGNGNRDRSREKRNNCRVYISNIPYDFRWQELKDLFRRIIGSVEYVELFHDENGKQRGCGMVQFKEASSVEKAIEKMNRYKINGRELVVKEDHGEPRDDCGRIISGGNRGGDRDGYSRRDDDIGSGRNNYMSMGNDFNNSSGNYNYYGLSASFLESLGITGPLHNKVFVANLDYKVDAKKLKQVFKLAGKVQSVDLSLDKDGASRGFAVIEYDHPVEAVQAISMLDRQMLYERRMTVRLDRIPDKGEGVKLPEGLGGVGIGLGPSGEPLKDVARNLPNMLQNQQSFGSQCTMPGGNNMLMGNNNMNMGNNNVGNTPVQPTPAPVTAAKPQQNMLGNAAGGLNLGNLSTTNLAALGAALSNPLLTSSLSSLGLSLGQGNSGLVGGGNNDDSMPSANAGLSNNYSTGGGNNYNPGGFGSSGGFNTGNLGGGGGGLLENDYKTGNMDLIGGGNSGNNAGNMGVTGNSRKSDTIIVKNLPISCTWQTLRDKFRDVGEVRFAEIRGNDVGIVRFFKERDAESSIAFMDGSRIDGRTIKVGYL